MIREIVADLRLMLPARCRVSQRNGWILLQIPDATIRLRPARAETLIARLPITPSQRSISVVEAICLPPHQHPKRRIMRALAKLRRPVGRTQ